MAQEDFGGTNTSTVGFTDQWVNSPGIPLPSSPYAADNGGVYALIFWMRAWVSGRGAARNVSLGLDGVGGTGTFSVGSSGSAQDTGAVGCSVLVAGGTGQFAINSSGSFYFGRGGSGSTNDNNGTHRSDGALGGSFGYFYCPSAPSTPSVSPGSTTALVSWGAPGDDGTGGSGLSGYRVEWSQNNFASVLGSVSVGVVSSTTITGLTAGQVYQFRVKARNATTDAAGVNGQASGYASVQLGTVPGAPTGQAAVMSAGAGTVSWVAPASTGGSPITNYAIDYSLSATFATGVSTRTVGSVLSATIEGLTPGQLYYFRVRAINIVGASANSGTASGSTPARGVLDVVRSASVTVGGATVSIRSDAGTPPVLTLGYAAFGSSAFTTIATLPDALATTRNLYTPGGERNVELCTDAAGNLYVIGPDAANPSALLVLYYANTGTVTAPVWTVTPVVSSQTLSSTGDPIVQIAASWVPGSGISPVPSVLVLVRRAGTVGAGSISYAVLNLTAVAAGTGTLFASYGDDPTWLATPPTGQAFNTGVLDMTPLVASSQRVAIIANGYAVIDLVNGIITSVSAAASGTSLAGLWARVIGVNTTSFAAFILSAGAITWTYYGTNGAVLGTGSLAATNANGGAFTDGWDVYLNGPAGAIVLYYVTSAAGARTLASLTISPTTYAAGTPATLTAALGAASSTNAAIRIPEGAFVDERRILIEADNLLSGVRSTQVYSDGSGNVAPNAPALVTVAGFDATAAFVFAWVFSDADSLDAQVTYDLQIQRVSDSVNVVDVSAIASATSSRTVAANTLANGINYRWRARVTDASGAQSAWSSYNAFTTSANGTLTITNPAAPDPGGVNVASYALAWSFTQPNGYVQTQRRVRVLNFATSAVLSDTTMQASTATTAAVALPSGVKVTLEVSIVTNAPGTPTLTTTTTITSSYSQPMTPTVVLVNFASYVQVQITNPVPTGSQPDTATNYIDRSPAGAATWSTIAHVGKNGVYNDHAVASGAAYDYRVRAETA